MDRAKIYRLFERAAVADIVPRQEQIDYFRAELLKSDCLEIAHGKALPAQKCLLSGELSLHASFAEAEFEEVSAEVPYRAGEEQLDFGSIPEPAWDGKASQQTLFDLGWFW